MKTLIPSYRLVLLLFPIYAGAIGCSRKPSSAEPADAGVHESPPSSSEQAAKHRDEKEHEELPSKVKLSPAVTKAANIKVVPAALESLPLTVSLTGEIVADPDKSAQVAARVPGRITSVHFKEGDRVTKGALLAIIESPDAGRARAAARSSEAKARAAKNNAERLQALAGRGLAAAQELKAAEAEATSLEAEAAAARETLRAFGAIGEGGTARLEVRAPLTGSVLTRNAVVGQTVPAEHLLTSIANLDEAFFLGRLFEKDLARVQAGAIAETRLNAYPTEVFEGRVESVGRQLDPTARTVVARIRVKDKSNRLSVGLFGTALVAEESSEPQEQRLVVPRSAVTEVADKTVVFVQHADGDYEVHPVTLGRAAAGRVEVLAGLSEGEAVVVDGAFTLKSAVLKSTFGEEEE